MGLFDIFSSNSFMDQIRCDEQNYLIWKWHPKGTISSRNNRENAIRWGSSLRVKDGEVAVFVYNQRNGVMQDYIVGPYDATLETDNLPVLASVVGLVYGGGTPFQAEVYFINLAQIIQVKFAYPFSMCSTPAFLTLAYPWPSGELSASRLRTISNSFNSIDWTRSVLRTSSGRFVTL